jgi:hypothetical protein
MVYEPELVTHFQNFFEESLRKGQISHYRLKKEIDTHFKNASDRETLYFILQQTILYHRGMVFLQEKDFVEGIKSKTKVWTEKTRFSAKTVRESIRSLEQRGIILLYKKSKQKVLYLLNIPKCQEIYHSLQKGEITLAEVQDFLDFEMRSKRVNFFAFGKESVDPTETKGKPYRLNREALPIQSVNSSDSATLEIKILKDLQELSTFSINNIINSNINNKQTNTEEAYTHKEKFPSSNQEQKLRSLLEIWKLSEKNAGTFISKNNQTLTNDDLKKALLMRISMFSEDLLHLEKNVNPELAKLREKFYEKAYQTLELCKLPVGKYSLAELTAKLLSGIEEYLRGE